MKSKRSRQYTIKRGPLEARYWAAPHGEWHRGYVFVRHAGGKWESAPARRGLVPEARNLRANAGSLWSSLRQVGVSLGLAERTGWAPAAGTWAELLAGLEAELAAAYEARTVESAAAAERATAEEKARAAHEAALRAEAAARLARAREAVALVKGLGHLEAAEILSWAVEKAAAQEVANA